MSKEWEDEEIYTKELRKRYEHLGPGWVGFHRAYVAGLLTPEDVKDERWSDYVSPSLVQIVLMEMIANTMKEFYTPEMIARIRGDK